MESGTGNFGASNGEFGANTAILREIAERMEQKIIFRMERTERKTKEALHGDQVQGFKAIKQERD